MDSAGTLQSCTLLDISESAIATSLSRLRSERPGVRTAGVVGDFLTDLREVGSGESRLIAFLGSTIGNIDPREVPDFFRSAAAILAPGDAVLVGLDLVKDRARLEAAYNDARGVTAEFNRNILRRDERAPRRRLRSRRLRPRGLLRRRAGLDRDAAARARRRGRPGPGRRDVAVPPRRGEIRTEISCKYTRESLETALGGTGLMLDEWWTDPGSLFALALLRRLGRA
jgi:L-histidine N-alpha-methyltransferase